MSKKGFSILELMVVVGIISVLLAVGLNTYTNVQRNARNTKRKADMKDVYAALESFRAENGSYPNNGREWWGEAPNPYGDQRPRTGAGGYIPGLAPVYIPVLPRDPRHGISNGGAGCTTTNGLYLYSSNGADFKFLAHCSPEGPMDQQDKFLDPCRPNASWQISSSIISRGETVNNCIWNSPPGPNGW